MLPNYINGEFWINMWPVLAFSTMIAAFSAFCLSGITTQNGRVAWFNAWAVLLAVSALGITIGLLAGQSREPAVTAVIGGVLGLLGGVMVYLVGTDSKQQKLSAFAVFVLSFSLLVGAEWGAALRQAFDDYRESASYRINKDLEDQDLRDRREQLGLPTPEPPTR